jgi:hypothetical protein
MKPRSNEHASKSSSAEILGKVFHSMASSDAKPHFPIPPTAAATAGNETFRTKSIATRLTETEFAEVESAAASAGKKLGEWLRGAALAQARSSEEERTDPVLLAEIMGMRTLMLNLFREASKGPISDESLRKMSAYSESIKKQKAEEFQAELRAKSGAKPPDKEQ